MTDTERYERAGVPSRPSLDGLEQTWSRRWAEEGTYAFDRSKDRADVYAIDTPPPTVSGELHIGHAFSYTHTDLVARFARMRGKAVFYPMGWDDNGLPTERRAQYRYGVRCDPSLPYDPSFAPPAQAFDPPRAISRKNFVELCGFMTELDERAYEALWRRLGLSVDWSYTYTTIGPEARALSQKMFLRNLSRGEAYQADAPTLWDVTFGTAVAQAELEDREQPGAFHRLRFGPVEIETTRPELLPACVALVCHPSDSRYAGLVGSTVRTPLFDVDVPVHAHPLADPEKGTGVAMVCTFGDLADVVWWRDLTLPTRAVIGLDGRFLATPPDGVAAAPYAPLAGLTVEAARHAVGSRLAESGDLLDTRQITHPVKFYEKGDHPLEIVVTRQWYLRNGGRDPALREALLARGRELHWVPAHMRTRYEHWVNGLTGDWLVSRQRFFGVPIPVWYALDASGEPDFSRPLVPAEEDLPVDPSAEPPPGYAETDRGRPGGFTGEPDVMDTWATSSVSPQLVTGWERDPSLFDRTFPLDLRPQGQEIIRTWLFGSVVRAHLEQGLLPWRTAVLSGWVLDPDRKKMSKSRGAALTPTGLLDRHGSDGVRYWAASGRPGTDLAVDEAQMKVGRRLATKVLNASRFVLGFGPSSGTVTGPLDRAMLAELSTVVASATASFEGYDHTAALSTTEAFFWTFCDDYIELVKERAYGGDVSARAALTRALSVQLRLFAPFLPFVTEEVWSWWQPGSVHRAAWPAPEPEGEPGLLSLAGTALGQVRRAKSARSLSMRAEVPLAVASGPAAVLERLALAAPDLRAAGRIAVLDLRPNGTPDLVVECHFPA